MIKRLLIKKLMKLMTKSTKVLTLVTTKILSASLVLV